MTIKWVDPPAPKRKTRSDETVRLLNRLKERPNEWARVAVSNSRKSAYQRVQLLRRAIKNNSELGSVAEFEFTTRTLGNNRGAVWARYTPTPNPIEIRPYF